MQTFTTTRGGNPVSLQAAVLQGLGSDGGLFVPSRAPDLDLVHAPTDSSIEGIARWVLPHLFSDLQGTAVERIVEHAFGFPVPVVELEPDRFVLELFHGPTHAFKDFGARVMAALLTECLPTSSDMSRTVLVATSGDTGGAVANAFHERRGYQVVALFPRGGISERQRRQMTTLGENVHAISVAGSFDDCQRLVKAALSDRELSRGHGLTSANSINVARLLPQAVYYVHAAHELHLRGRSSLARGDIRPHFVVPSGNLGNLCAGLIASRGGMPNSGFTAAVNANRGFADYLQGAPFEPRPSVATASNAMDVGMPSNLERIMWLYGHDDSAVRRDVVGVSVDDETTAMRIREVYERTGYVLDPHTAVAYEAASRHDARSDTPIVVLATAHPGKFPEVVEAQIGHQVPLPPGLLRSQAGAEHMNELAADIDALRGFLEALPH